MPAHYPSISKIDSPDTMKGATNSLLGSMGSTSKITDTYAAKLHEQLGSLGLDEEGFLTAVEDSRETAFGLAPHLLAAAGGNFSYVLQDEEGGKEEDAAALADQVINTHPSAYLPAELRSPE
ncbi:MAG: hypothetical protein QF815_04030 [Candidatus Peribacteraceae bacterium]|nr:hypothetical protein [Candidatus Peribacteraceae bacterium]